MICDDSVYLQRAMHCYQNIQCCSLVEFNEDLNRIITIKKAISRYKNSGELNVRLLLNQFIIVSNVFGAAAFDMIKYKIEKENHDVAFPFLATISILPEHENIMFDQVVVEKIKEAVQ